MKNNFKKYRNEKGLSQEETAKALVLSRQALSAIEGGKSSPSIETLSKAAKFFGVTIEALINESPTQRV